MITRYRHLVISGFVGEPVQSELEAIEQKLGASLPVDFVEFLNVANGGNTVFSASVPPSDGEPIGLSSLYSTKSAGTGESIYETFLGQIELARQNPTMPEEVLPFADNGGGSTFYLDLTPDGQGRVVVFRHGLPAWTGRPSDDAFIQVARTFVEFVDSLFIETDYAKVILEDAIASQGEEYIAVVKASIDVGFPDWRERLGMDV